MEEINLIFFLEKISSKIPMRILKLEGYILKENHKERLEIIIFKGFSSSTTYPIEMDIEKKFLNLIMFLTTLDFNRSPLKETEDRFIRQNQNSNFFLNQEKWI